MIAGMPAGTPTTDSLLGAITNVWTNHPGLHKLCPQIWTDEVPEKDEHGNRIGFPYCQLVLEEETPDPSFENTYTEDNRVTFNIFVNTRESGRKIRRQLKAVMDNAFPRLPVVDLEIIHVDRIKGHVEAQELVDRSGNRIFQYKMTYTIITETLQTRGK